MLPSPSALAFFISCELFRTGTDASCTHGLCLEVPLEFIITAGNKAFSTVPLALSQEQKSTTKAQKQSSLPAEINENFVLDFAGARLSASVFVL